MEPTPHNVSGKIITALVIGLLVGFTAGVFWQVRRSSAGLESTASEQADTMEKKTKVVTDAATAPAQSAQVKVNEKSQTAAAVASISPSALPAEIAVADQAAGNTVAVALLSVREPVWVAVREISSLDGKPGNILGAHKVFPEDKSVIVELLRSTKTGSSYVVVLHKDVGTPAFNYREDVLIEGAGGKFTAR